MGKNTEKVEKIKKYIQEYKWYVLILLTMLLVAMFFYFDVVKKISMDEGGLYFADDITWDNPIDITNDKVIQTYTTTRAEISYIGLGFKREGEFEDDACVWIQVENDRDKSILQEWRIPVNGGVADFDNYACVNYPMDNSFIGDKGQKLNIKISVENPGNNGKVYVATGKHSSGYYYGELYINGNKVDNQQLAINIYGKVKYIRTMYVLIVLGFMILVPVLMIGIRKRKWTVERVFLILAIFLGGLYLVIFTPGTEPDGDAHFATAYYDANILLHKEATDSNGNIIMRASDVQKDGVSHIVQLRNINTVKEKFFERVSNKQLVSFYRGRLKVPITAHLPQSIGISIGILTGSGATATAYCGKIFALLFYVICCYIGIHLMPFGKNVIAFVALLPFSMEAATSYSYDCVVLALSFLMIGYVMYLAYEKEKMTWKDVVVWCILTAWIGPCKVVYVLLGGLILIVPRNKYKNKKMYWGTMVIVLLAGIASIYITRLSFVSSMITGNITKEYYTVSMFLKNIPQGLLMIGKAIDLYFDDYMKQMFGSMYSWMDINLPFTFVVMYVSLMLLISVRPEKERYEITKLQKGIVIGLCVLISGGIVAGMMFSWTLKDSVAVEGIQGRYFLPILPMFILAIRNKWLVVKKNIDGYSMIAIGILQYVTYLKLFTMIISR